MVRLVGLEPTASAFAGLRSIHLSYKRTKPILILVTCVTMIPEKVVPKGRFVGASFPSGCPVSPDILLYLER